MAPNQMMEQTRAASNTRTVQNSSTAILDQLLPSDVDKKRFVDQQFRRALDATNRKRTRLYQNLSYYFGDQIPDQVKAKADQESRELMVYNISQRKVQGLVGSLMRNSFNIAYMSVDGTNTTLIQGLQDMLQADQNSGNWDFQFMSFLKYGMIEESIMELTTSNAESPLGNLRFECTQPGSVIIDPNWRTTNSADMQECFKYIYLSPTQCIDLYPDMEDAIKAAVIERVRFGRNYEQRDENFNQNYQTILGSDYMILQYMYMEPTRSHKEIDIKSGLELPDTKDIQYKMRWIEINGIDPEYVRDIAYSKKVCKVITTIPGLLQLPVQDKLHELQIERIPFFPWAAERINGETRSIIDIVKGMQDTLNKRENMLSNIIENSANGAALLDPDVVDNDPDQKRLIQQNWSNPRFKAWTVAGKLASGKTFIAELPKSAPPAEVFAQINHLWEGIDRVLPINAAADGRAESAQESGILYSMKQQAIEVAQTTLVRGIMSSLTEMGDAYFRAAKAYYSDVERVFVRPDGSTFKINEIMSLPTGDLGIKNDVSSLQNLKTLVKMGQDSPNTRFSRRLIALDLLKLIPPTMPVLQTEVIGEIMATIEVSDEFKARMDSALDQERQLAASQEEATYSANKANTASAINAMQQPAQQAQAQMAQQGQPNPQVQPAAQGQPGPQVPPPPPQQGIGTANKMMQKLAPLLGAGG